MKVEKMNNSKSKSNIDLVKKHGIHEQDLRDINIQNLERNGFTILKNIIPKDVTQEIKIKMYECYEAQKKEVGGIENLKKIRDEGIIRVLFSYDRIFLKEVLMNETVLGYLDIFLDKTFTLYSQVGVFSEPRTELYQTAWHREIQYQHYISSRPLAIQSLFILDPFNSTTGGTFFLPGSHLFEKFPSDEFVLNNQIQPSLSEGDVVLMNSMVYHKAGINTSLNDRLLITTTYTRPNLASMFNHTSMIRPESLSEREREILGFRWNYNQSMLEWRKSRI